MSGGRYFGLDLIRFFAILSVVCVHFLYNIGFDNVIVHGERFFLASVFRGVVNPCVPLFFMLSGYLMKNKKPVKSYYNKFIRLFVLFLMAGILSNIFRILALGQQMSAKDWLSSFTYFSAVGYGWYLRAYIGLFVLIPFLNIMIHTIKAKRQYRVLLLSLLLVFSLPTFLNYLGFRFPDHWANFYPVIYYLLGTYISIYKPKPRKGLLLAGIVGISILYASIIFLMKHGQKCEALLFQYGNLIVLFIGVMLFLLLYQVKAPRVHFLCRFVSSVSRVSYSMFLISWIYDRTIYSFLLNPFVPSFYDRLFFVVLTVPAVFLLSYLSALVLEGGYNFVAAKGKQLFFKQTV
ncbi:MAG: hypothetical protein DBY25_04390 [Clostridiales bacterium]|nr:MAG: hypothetical protein DBY25_04390 [Clostridiales bacterium]